MRCIAAIDGVIAIHYCLFLLCPLVPLTSSLDGHRPDQGLFTELIHLKMALTTEGRGRFVIDIIIACFLSRSSSPFIVATSTLRLRSPERETRQAHTDLVCQTTLPDSPPPPSGIREKRLFVIIVLSRYFQHLLVLLPSRSLTQSHGRSNQLPLGCSALSSSSFLAFVRSSWQNYNYNIYYPHLFVSPPPPPFLPPTPLRFYIRATQV